jgi:hypothetical protein
MKFSFIPVLTGYKAGQIVLMCGIMKILMWALGEISFQDHMAEGSYVIELKKNLKAAEKEKSGKPM